MKVISFGDSYTSGVGTDRVKEQEIKDSNNTNKDTARDLYQEFTTSHSFTRYFADKLKLEWINKGEPGCSNRDIVTNIFQYYADRFFTKGDIVLVSFSSTLRDQFPFFPILKEKQWKGISWNVKDIFEPLKDVRSYEEFKKSANRNDLLGLSVNPENISTGFFMNEYKKFFLTEMFDYRYFDFFNFNMIALLQEFFDFIEVDYILIDAFEPSFYGSTYDKRELIEKYAHYWKYNEHSIFSYLEQYEDSDLFELDGYASTSSVAAKHPSKKGHKLFANSLHKHYIRTRDID